MLNRDNKVDVKKVCKLTVKTMMIMDQHWYWYALWNYRRIKQVNKKLLLDSRCWIVLLFNNVVSIFYGAIISKRDKRIAPVPQSRIFSTYPSLSLVGEAKIRRVWLHGGSWHAFQKITLPSSVWPLQPGNPSPRTNLTSCVNSSLLFILKWVKSFLAGGRGEGGRICIEGSHLTKEKMLSS